MDFATFVTQYLNKRDSTGMYYMVSQIAAESGTDEEKIKEYLDFCQQANLRYIMRTGRIMPDQLLIVLRDVWDYISDRKIA